MLRVWLASAAASEATNISSSPMPKITGLPLRATTIDFGLLGVEHREAVGARHEAQRRAHAVLERVAGHGGDQVREHFGIGLRLEHDALRFQPRAQLGRVLDDAVVDDRVAVRGVAVRVRVAIARLAVRRPARVRDAGAAAQLLRQLALELADLALALVHAQLAAARDASPAES